jgi:hypothetical protein
MSRQERRKAESDAAKRAKRTAGAAGARGGARAAGAARAAGPAGAGVAGGAGGAAAARANVNVIPLGDWTTQAADPYVLHGALGVEILKQRADAGDREAQWSLGFWLVADSDVAAGVMTTVGASGRSPKADVGFAVFALAPHSFPVAH